MSTVNFDEKKNNFINFYNTNISNLQGEENNLKDIIHLILRTNEQVSEPEVISRVKICEEAIKKFKNKYLSKLEQDGTEYEIKDYITDLIGIRVICLYEVDVDIIKEVLSKEFEVINITDKSSILESQTDTFGYKGLHLDLKLKPPRGELVEHTLNKNYQFEVQIRTNIQDAWSVLEHAIKYKKNTPAELKRRLNRLAALFEIADQEFGDIKKITTNIKEKEDTKTLDSEEILDAFNCYKIMADHFQDFKFHSNHVDEFVSDIQRLFKKSNDKPFLTKDLILSLKKNTKKLEEYSEHLKSDSGNTMNPYTLTRHSLYMTNLASFELILFSEQRGNFQKWLDESPALDTGGL
jgi:putative GTP pyrophosphokinase